MKNPANKNPETNVTATILLMELAALDRSGQGDPSGRRIIHPHGSLNK